MEPATQIPFQSPRHALAEPLQNAISIAESMVNNQLTLLNIARETVVPSGPRHVVLPEDLEAYENSVDSVLKAWEAANETYRSIFQSIVRTAGGPHVEHKSRRRGLPEYVEMAKIAEDVCTVSRKFVNYSRRQKGKKLPTMQATTKTSCMHVELDENDEDEHSASHTRDNEPTNSQGVRKQQGVASSGVLESRKPAGVRKAQANPHPAKRSRTILPEDYMRRLERCMMQFMSSGETGTEIPDSTPPPVEYEDVSDAVEARLKAKGEKREAAKKQKKRKRDSGDSLNALQTEEAGEPSKKRKKASSGVEEVPEEVPNGGGEKHGLDDEELGHDQSRKKTKT